MRVFQITPALFPGDAIGNNVFMIDKALRNANIETEVYADLSGRYFTKIVELLSYDDLPKLNPDDVILYHMCGVTEIGEGLRALQCKKIAIYHNTTPASFFMKFCPEFYKSQQESMLNIQRQRDCFDWCIADSEFNKQDLVKLGYNAQQISVIPILLDFDDYKQKPDKNVIKKYKDGYTNILFVGRLAPNKKQEDIIRIFAYYKAHINPKSRLILVGPPMGNSYFAHLKAYVDALSLQDVLFTEKVRFNEILAFYSIADVFVCMSEHEGFCVPLVEAMLFNVPIIAYNSTAIPYTLGDSGILVNDKNPVLISKLINKIITDKDLKQSIISRQQKQLKHFDEKAIFKQILKVIEQTL